MTEKRDNYGLNELFMVGINDITISEDVRNLLPEIRPGSVILTLGFFRALRMRFDSKSSSKEFVKKFLQEIKNLVPGILISCDHEGGMIQNFTPPDFTLIPPFRRIGDRNSEKEAYLVGEIMAKELNAVGVDWVFGPVVDVSTHPKYYYRPFGRALSDDPNICANLGVQIIRAIQSNGMISCVKHFPNMGSCEKDSHRIRPTIDRSEDQFFKTDLLPFQKAHEQGKVMSMMTNHAKYVHIDDTTCATFSKKINTDILRKQINFKGVLLTDDLGMGGIYDGEKQKQKLDPTTVCYRSLIAGCDVLMFSFDINRARIAYYGLLEKIEKEKEVELKNRIFESFERVKKMKEMHWKNRELKSFSLEVLRSEEHQRIVKQIGYSFNDDILDGKKREMSVGMDCNRSNNKLEKNVSEDSEWNWPCNIL